MIVPSYHFMIGPFVAMCALGVIVLLCRWVFSTDVRDDRTARRLEKARARGDYGLLVPVAAVRDEADGTDLRDRLRVAGVRATLTADAEAGSWAVLVFRADAGRAQELVASWAGPSA